MKEYQKKLRRDRFRPLFQGRRTSQVFFLAAFVILFIATDYSGSDQIAYAVNIFFRLDPFLAAVTMIAVKTVIALMLPAVVVLLLVMVAGRSFCGWFCPLGTMLDGARHVLPEQSTPKETFYPRLGRLLLLTTLLLAFFGFHIAGYLDPFSILVRGLAQTVYPAFHGLMDRFFTFTYTSAPAFVNTVTEPVYAWMKDVILPGERKFFELVYLSFLILLAVFLLEMVQKRFFCRNICPLGAMLGLISRRGLLKTLGGSASCGKCRICASLCRMGSIDDARTIDMSTCNLCIECAVHCPRQIISFSFAVQKKKEQRGHNTLTRRHFLGIVASGILLPSVKGTNVLAKYENPLLIRPPGALAEPEFIARCVRCAECMQVCIGNALQPSLLEGGIDAVFTPKLVARTGYCEYNCTLCGQVCPSGAIRLLSLAEKHLFKIGNAVFDINTCLPYAKGIPCMVCEEHCPTAEKAIRFREVEVVNGEGTMVRVKQPYVVDGLCIGCGICENKCPLPGRAAIIVSSANEERNPTKKLPAPAATPYG